MIEITISEVDRQTAERYTRNGCCLIATALMNRGYNVRSVCPAVVYLPEPHLMTGGWPGDLHVDYAAEEKPFYRPEVVGHVVRIYGIEDKEPNEKTEEKPALFTA